MGKAGPAAVPFLATVLTNRAAIPRATAAMIIGSFGTNAMPTVPTLLQTVSDADQEVAAAALWALGAVMQDEEVFAAVTGALNDPRRHIRLTAVHILRTAGDKAAPFLQRALDDPDTAVRYEATAMLNALAPATPTNAPPH
jgi:HEAT repeat protein